MSTAETPASSAPAAASRPPPLAASAPRPIDFPTWLPAMLVKELRQGLRARGFVGALVGFQVIMALVAIFAIAGGANSYSFTLLQNMYWAMLALLLLVVTPIRAMAALQNELETRSLDLLLLTQLTSWRIVLGKWSSLLVQAALLVIAMLPYGVARYFFGSVDLAGEGRMIALMAGGSALLTAAALWASALPKVMRIGLIIVAIFAFQASPFSLMRLFSPMLYGGPSAPSSFGNDGWIILFNCTVLLVICLVGAVRRLAPPAENHSALLRALPLAPLVLMPFVDSSNAKAQAVFAAVLFGAIAALELARNDRPLATHQRAWARLGAAGRTLARLATPGWSSAFEYVLVIAVAAALGGLFLTDHWRIAQLSLVAVEALALPALFICGVTTRAVRRPVAYGLILGGGSLVAGVAAGSAKSLQSHTLSDAALELLPISSFWMRAVSPATLTSLVGFFQGVIAFAIIGATWWQALKVREQQPWLKTRARRPLTAP